MVSAGRRAAAIEALQEHRWDVNAFLNWLNAFLFSKSACTGPNCVLDSVLCNSDKFPRLSASSLHVPLSSHKSHLVTVNYSIVVRLRGD